MAPTSPSNALCVTSQTGERPSDAPDMFHPMFRDSRGTHPSTLPSVTFVLSPQLPSTHFEIPVLRHVDRLVFRQFTRRKQPQPHLPRGKPWSVPRRRSRIGSTSSTVFVSSGRAEYIEWLDIASKVLTRMSVWCSVEAEERRVDVNGCATDATTSKALCPRRWQRRTSI